MKLSLCAVLVGCITSACRDAVETSTSAAKAPASDASSVAAPVQREPELSVYRSVLDGKPGVLSAALRKDLWIAYDTRHASLFKVWRDGVSFDGAVYNTHHGPQPTSQGEALLVNTFEEPWYVVRDGVEQRPRVRYRGHSLRDGHLVLHYTLLPLGAAAIEIDERPVLRFAADGGDRLERTFELGPVAPGMQVELAWKAGANGRLALQASASTSLELALPAARTSLPLAAAADEPVSAVKAMAESDCAVCHNATSQAIGPSFRAIAARYRTNSRTIAGLARKIVEGGAYEWGDVAMVAHPFMDIRVASEIARHILSTYDPDDRAGTEVTHILATLEPYDAELEQLRPGVNIAVFELGHHAAGLPQLAEGTLPNTRLRSPAATIDATNLAAQGCSKPEQCLLKLSGYLKVERPGEYDFRIAHDGAAELTIREQRMILDARTEERRTSPWASLQLPTGVHDFELTYRPSASRDSQLELRWQPPGEQESIVPLAVLSATDHTGSEVSAGIKPYLIAAGTPGDRRPLDAVHPSFDRSALRPHHWKPMVGGLDSLPDGRPVVSTWDAEGAVYVLDNPDEPDPERLRVRKIASGLSEPLGLKVVDGAIYVLQKHELTKLVDDNGDGLIDSYLTVNNQWGTTGNFHEFAFGLAYQSGWFYATLSTGVDPGGVAMKHQHPDRGSVIRIARDTGELEFVARGLRTPNGIAAGADDALFVTDNQGDWLPANKLVHVQAGAFYGARVVEPPGVENLKVTQPVAWLPMEEISYSPSQPVRLDAGPYQNQMLYGDVTYGGLNRVTLHRVSDQYQGCVMPFTQGLEAGVNRLALAPDGSIYVGGIGNPADWGQEGKLWYGLERLRYNGETTFELLDVEVHADGLELTFTEPLRAADGNAPQDYALKTWRYQPTAAYGGPKLDEHTLLVRTVRVSADRRRVFLGTRGLQTGYVVHVHLVNAMVSQSERELWATEAWCTINAFPPERGLEVYATEQPSQGFRALDLAAIGPQGRTHATSESFGDFELELEWRADGPGVGVLAIRQSEPAPACDRSPAITLRAAAEGTPALELAGGLLGLQPPARSVARAEGQYNRTRIVARGSRVEHWLNGRKVLSYDSTEPRATGVIVIRDCGAKLQLRNARIRP